MFLMKILKLILLFLTINLFISCANNLKKNQIKSNYETTSDFGRFLSSRYSLNKGDNDSASKIISKSKNLHLDLDLAEMNFTSYLINGNFKEANEFKLIAPITLNKLPMYHLPDFVINLKNGNFKISKDFNFMKNQLPGFRIIFEKLNYFELIKTKNLDNFNKDKSNIFNLLIFENTKIENQIYLNMPKNNLSLIENILYLKYLYRKYPKKFQEEINNFSLNFNFDIKFLELYFEKINTIKSKPNHKYIFANLFSYLSFLLSSEKNIPNSYLKILNEISYYLDPSIGNSNYYLAQVYSNEKNFQIALNKLNRIEKDSLMFLNSKIKRYEILKIIDQNKSNLLLKSIKKQYPENSKVMLLIANNYRSENKCNKAIKIYDKLIQKNSDTQELSFYKAICLEKLNQWEGSKKLLKYLLSSNPNNAYILNYLSYSMAIRNEDLLTAKKLITKALKLEKNNGYFLDTLGWIQFKLNDIENAIRTIQLAIEKEPNNSEIIDHLGDIYYKVGRTKEAIFEWNRALIGNADNKLKKDIKSKLKKINE